MPPNRDIAMVTRLSLPLFLALIASSQALGAEWHSIELQALHGRGFHEPFNPDRVAKRTLTLSHAAQLRLDVGDLLDHPGRLYLGVEYQYWRNKFGMNGLSERLPQALLVWRF